MKKINLIFIFLFLTSGTLMAQIKDSPSAKGVVEKGTKGDIILGKDTKKKQLMASPQVLKQQSHAKTPYVAPKKKKHKSKPTKK